jgi:DNA replication protein DnaC
MEIPQKLKPKNFMIESFIQKESNQSLIISPKMYLRNYTMKEIRILFLIEYKTKFNREFESTNDSNELLYTIICYFFKDDRFFRSPCLNFPEGSTPSFSKGLLIMGNYGIGKTSILLALEQVFNKFVFYNPASHFKSIAANDVVTEYEKIQTAEEKEDFYLKHQRGFRFYDDVKTEDVASNYGKVNLFEKIISLRDSKRSKTLISCNFDPAFPNDFAKGLDQFGTKYGGHIYDRILNNFNFIQGNGKSFRG